jgi:hypothetical protein
MNKIIVVPMAGNSSRFFKNGFIEPKYMLKVLDKSLFYYSVTSFKKYFSDAKFIFICKSDYNTVSFVQSEILKLGISNYEILVLDKTSKGQAETVYIGLNNREDLHDHEVWIFNIDTMRRGLHLPEFNDNVNGALEYFIGHGDSWSFIQTRSDDSSVLLTTEKIRISEKCSTGLYFFKNPDIYCTTYLEYYSDLKDQEHYIAPMYNRIIGRGGIVTAFECQLSEIINFGTPKDYEIFKKNYEPQ